MKTASIDLPREGWAWDAELGAWVSTGGSSGGGSGGSYDDAQIKADLATETQARADGDSGLQDQIDNLSAGGVDLPEMTSDATKDTLVLRDENANAKFNLITAKNFTMNQPTISSNTADTWFLSGGEQSAHGVKKNDAAGMRSSLDVYSKSESDALSGGGAVDSVNGQTGAVILSAADVGAMPSNYSAPVDSVNGQTGVVILNAADVGALPSNYTPPAAPVTSVNGETGAVNLSAADVGAQVAGSYAASNHNHSGVYATASHTHSEYAASNHTHSGYVSTSGDTTISGTLYATDFVASSDENLKDNITTVPVGFIDGIKGREWDWKESGEKGSGVIAQEVEKAFPHLVHTDDEGMKSVAYNGLIAYLIEEIKDCRERIFVLEAK